MPNTVSVKCVFLKTLQGVHLQQVYHLFYPEIKSHTEFVRQSKEDFSLAVASPLLFNVFIMTSICANS